MASKGILYVSSHDDSNVKRLYFPIHMFLNILNVNKSKNFAESHIFWCHYLSLVMCVMCNAVSVCKHGGECFPAVVLMSGRANQLLTAHSPWEWICQAVIELLSVLDASRFACQELSRCKGISCSWVYRNKVQYCFCFHVQRRHENRRSVRYYLRFVS